ncbi:hypothetical protein SAMD00019534_112710 [Acytostelium subglobosum LB1]|uniref:hypothetical protein n=1 Tax=Acytostelium subglobosum LB1 TaxID=1410327 RepID=UPI000644B0EC|nr:hypothetical protein SAMD00019534_112710 [Acytostelium subglobosum LB1]GAM28095.1 hypothetical protein SAMD00019534_112710 [Acytostelium subglobosum LB1]|eukprot:XP_012749054.1 hypothetical protein SAMD00019534_112710 [Acytostelium subglobosum LB1]
MGKQKSPKTPKAPKAPKSSKSKTSKECPPAANVVPTEGEVVGPFDPLAKLSEDELKAYNEFKELTKTDLELDNREREWLTDMCCLRYLRARDYDLTQSFNMLKKTLAWRRDYKPWEITAEHLSFEAATGKQYVNGKIKDGKPVIYMRPSRENTKTHDRQIQLMVYTLERAIEQMDAANGVEQVALMIDFSGYSMFNMPPTSVSKQCLDILSDHYPERLGYAFIIDPPYIFNIFWNFVSPFINKHTSKKIHFLKGEKLRRNILSQHFDEQVLEKEYGGVSEFSFVREEYWRDEIINDRAKRGLPSLDDAMLNEVLALKE